MLQSDLGSKNGELSGLIDKYKKEAITSQAECVNVKKTLETQARQKLMGTIIIDVIYQNFPVDK